MILHELRLLNFRGIRRLDVPFESKLTVLVGENGVGKTAILDAIAIGLSQYVARLSKTSSSARRLTLNDVRNGQGTTAVDLTVEAGGNLVRWAVVKQGPQDRILNAKSSDFKQLTGLIKEVAARQGDGDAYLHGETPVIYYNNRRANVAIPKRKRSAPDRNASSVFAEGLTTGAVDFRKLIYWFQECESEELRQQKNTPKYVDRKLDAVRRAITGSTGLKNPRYNFGKKRGFTVTKGNSDLLVDQLSTGEQAFLGLASDLARRLSIVYSDEKDTLKGSAVVLIDELELHLHPRWQRKILPWLLETFTGCQFVVSTHSPQMLGEIHAENIRILSVKDGEVNFSVPNSTFGRDSNYLLNTILGTDERRSTSKDLLEEVDQLVAAGELTKAIERLETLRHAIEGAAPETGIIEARIARRLNAQK